MKALVRPGGGDATPVDGNQVCFYAYAAAIIFLCNRFTYSLVTANVSIQFTLMSRSLSGPMSDNFCFIL